jgi:hypothetical protein
MAPHSIAAPLLGTIPPYGVGARILGLRLFFGVHLVEAPEFIQGSAPFKRRGRNRATNTTRPNQETTYNRIQMFPSLFSLRRRPHLS